MLIDEEKLGHWIDNFYGYGSWRSRLWFIPNEEDGGELPEAVAARINAFHALCPGRGPAICDIRKMSKLLPMFDEGPKKQSFDNRFEYRFGPNAVLHGVWKNLIAFTRGYDAKEVPDALSYQRDSFLQEEHGTESLIPLYPLPGPRSHAWYYSWLHAPGLPFLRSRAAYEEHVYPARTARILANIETYRPAVVLMYGMDNINKLKDTFQRHFGGCSFTLVKAVKQQIPQHHRARAGETTILITTQIPALRHRRIETGFDWEEFGNMVRGAV